MSETKAAGTPGERVLFLRQFLTAPRYLGSITPSSRFLVATLLGLGRVAEARQIVELGPGTGPFTSGLLQRMPAEGRLLCIERDPQLADHLRARFEDARLTVVTGDAQALQAHLAQSGFEPQVPLIVSGLPFTSLPPGAREGCIQAVVAALAPDGDFLLYQYSYAMRGFLQQHFRKVEGQWELRNIPPAVCMRCRL